VGAATGAVGAAGSGVAMLGEGGTQGSRRPALPLLPGHAAWYDAGLLAASPGRAPPGRAPPPPDLETVTAPHRPAGQRARTALKKRLLSKTSSWLRGASPSTLETGGLSVQLRNTGVTTDTRPTGFSPFSSY